MNRRLLPAALLALILACAPSEPAPSVATADSGEQASPAPPQSDSTWIGYRAGGNEPFWNLTLGQATMHFADMGIADSVRAARPAARPTAGGWRFEATANGRPFVAGIERKGCNDSMSGRPFPHSVTVTVNGRTYTGCGGETASLIAGAEWKVVQLDGAATAALQPTITFGSDGFVTGNGGCNTFRGPYRITGEGLDIGPVGATKRACGEAALNQQESKFFGMLDRVSRFDLVGGTLELYVSDVPVIVAERPR